MPRVSKKQYKGVYKLQKTCVGQKSNFMASIYVDGRSSFLGVFETERQAALAYDKVAIRYGRKTNILKKVA